MISDREFKRLAAAFELERKNAVAFAEAHNSSLPRDCPACGDEGHVPGLRCPACGYRHTVSWAILRDGEWGYDVVTLTPPRRLLAAFVVEV